MLRRPSLKLPLQIRTESPIIICLDDGKPENLPPRSFCFYTSGHSNYDASYHIHLPHRLFFLQFWPKPRGRALPAPVGLAIPHLAPAPPWPPSSRSRFPIPSLLPLRTSLRAHKSSSSSKRSAYSARPPIQVSHTPAPPSQRANPRLSPPIWSSAVAILQFLISLLQSLCSGKRSIPAGWRGSGSAWARCLVPILLTAVSGLIAKTELTIPAL